MTTAASETTLDDRPASEIMDVWSRAAPKYRVRATVLLLVNLVLFAGLGCFAYWLRTGHPFAFLEPNYWQIFVDTIRPRGDATLANFVLFPIRIDQTPMHGVVVGLLLAALVSIPILIAILYRFPCCLPFIAVVGFFAVMPWLAINLIGACILASVRPFRFRFRYASALLGLLLVLLYFYGASRQSTMAVELYKPEDRIKFIAPWILATLASCVIMGGVLLLSKLVNYRPGVVAPLLLLCFAVPVVIFERSVGRDALYYRLLERRFQNQFYDRKQVGDRYAGRDGGEWFERTAYEVWQAKPSPKPKFEATRSNAEFRMSLELEAQDMGSAFAESTMALVDECDDFLWNFPYSRYAPNVLYLKGQALDMRVDLNAFHDRKVIRYYDDFASPQSQFTWHRVLANAGKQRMGVVARYKLATFEARARHVDKAIALLDELLDQYDSATVEAQKTGAPEDSLRIPLEDTVFDARRLRSLLMENRGDPRYGLRPLCGSKAGEPWHVGYLQLDPHHPSYSANLQKLLTAYPDSLLMDNLALERALLIDDPDARVRKIDEVIEKYPRGDAHPKALYMKAVAWLDAKSPVKARSSLETLLQQYPDSVWATPARNRLRALGPATADATE